MDTKALWKLSYGIYVVGVKKDGTFGGCVVDAVAQVAGGEHPVIVLASMKNNLTNALIKKEGEFTLSVVPADVDPFIVANFGYQSARDADKWANVKYSLKNGLPVLDCNIAYLRCKVQEAKEFETHTLFICETVEAQDGASAAKPLGYADYRERLAGPAKAAFDKFKATGQVPDAKPAVAKWRCTACGYVYDGGIPFDQLPDDWTCPLCGCGKDMLEKVTD